MTLLETTEVKIEWTDIEARTPKQRPPYSSGIPGRSPGIHVSNVIRYNWFGTLPPSAERIKKENEAAQDLEDARVMPLRMALGMAFEDWVVGLYPSLIWQPGEKNKDGIYGSIDGWSHPKEVFKATEHWRLEGQHGRRVIEEFKLTWKSYRNREILREVIWMWQLAAYCYLWETRFARLHVCWVNGDYSHGEDWGPRYFRYLIEFKQSELDRIWKSMFVGSREKASVLLAGAR